MTSGAKFRRAWLKEFETDGPAEAALLDQAAAILDEVELLEERLTADGPIVAGSKGQPIVHPAVAALRSHRAAFARLAALLHPDHRTETPSQQAARAARARWGR